MAKKEVTQKATPRPEHSSDIRREIKMPSQLYRITTNMLVYKNAVNAAENIFNPQRFQLYQVYKQTELDAHLTAAMQQLKNLILGSDFIVTGPDGEEVEEKTKLIKTKWFRDFLDLAMDSVFWGNSLIQFNSIVNINGQDEFKDVQLVPRIYVKPEYHIVTEDYAATVGTDYLDEKWRQWVIGVGKPYDLGLLLKAAPLVIWKKNAMGAWAEFVEKFGVPPRIGKTNVRDELTRQNMENMLKNMSVALWAVLDTDDEIELIETKTQDAYQVFDMMITRCNAEISKLILGQTATMDEKSFVGSAEVMERVLEGYADMYTQFIESVCNYQLIPLLNMNDFGFEGLRIVCQPDDDFSLDEKSKLDIALINSGKYKLTPEYLKEKYNTEVVEVEEPTDDNEDFKKNMNKYYGE